MSGKGWVEKNEYEQLETFFCQGEQGLPLLCFPLAYVLISFKMGAIATNHACDAHGDDLVRDKV